MASIGNPIDDDFKALGYHELEKTGVTPVKSMRHALRHVRGCGQLPSKLFLMTEDDSALIATVRERLAKFQRVRVSLDNL